jgi:predicted nucleotidyltransferase
MKNTTSLSLRLKLAPFCERLSRLYQEPVVLLCGSTALAENMPWSDIDLIVIAGFDKPFAERLEELALLNDTGLGLEFLGYTPEEFLQMLDRLNPGAIEALEFGIPIMSGKLFFEMRQKLAELEKLGLTKTRCTYFLAQETKR